MAINRVLLHLHHRSDVCHCQSAQRLLDRVTACVKPIEEAASGAIEFWLPGIQEILDDGFSEVGFILKEFRPEAAPIDGDIAGHVASELRRIATRLAEAANRIKTLRDGRRVS